jgi:hypothetical protein
MKHNHILFLLLAFPMFAACTKIDNYASPDGDIYGILTDKLTKDSFQSEQPNGFLIKLFEEGGKLNSPVTFWGKPDGTFENANIFTNEYKVLPMEGAFFPVDTLTVKVGKRTQVDFEVMPFLAVTDVTVTPSSGKVSVSYKIVRGKAGDKIVERKTLVSHIPIVSNVVFDFKSETDLTGIDDDKILSTGHTDVVTGLTSGNTYYVRIAVRTDNALKKYNYSKTFQVMVP